VLPALTSTGAHREEWIGKPRCGINSSFLKRRVSLVCRTRYRFHTFTSEQTKFQEGSYRERINRLRKHITCFLVSLLGIGYLRHWCGYEKGDDTFSLGMIAVY